MNKKKLIIIILIVTILIAIISISLVSQIIMKNKNIDTNNTYKLKETTVTSQTIIKEFSSSLEVSSQLVEKIELHATYYFSELLAETNTYIKEGTNILKYTNGSYLVAPFDLVVTKLSLPKTNEMCTNSHFIEVHTTQTLRSNIEINESDMEFITLGREVDIVINAIPNTVYKGYITEISEIATNSKFAVNVTYINDDNIKLGMSGYATIALQEIVDVAVIPIEAVNIKEDNTKYVILSNEKGETSEKIIKTGISNSNYVEIKEGLDIGQTIKYENIII